MTVMTRTRILRILAIGLAGGCGLLAGTAEAYIDPGTGSYVLQIAIAFLVGLAFSVKVFWKKISIFLKKTFSSKDGNGPDAS
jgi:hypothetical protein